MKDNLKKIIDDLRSNHFEISTHAFERMSERNISAIDIVALIESSALEKPAWNDLHSSWNFTGLGFSTELFTIACTYDNGTLILTVFWE
jgi:hypothetical protein